MSLSIDVIVRTLGDAPRSGVLFRALDSIQGQKGITTRPIVVVNGDKFERTTITALQNRPGILLHQEQQASMKVARAAGRALVTAPFFAYLDDDDELIVDSLLEPMSWLDSHPDCDVLICNGYFVKAGGVCTESTNLATHVSDPATGLLKECWLSPGACVFRTASVPVDILSADWTNMEWTQLAFELCAARKRLHFMDVPTVRYYDTPGSTSKQIQHHEAEVRLLRLVQRDARLDPDVRLQANRKYLRVLHDLSMKYWRVGQFGRAWRCHLMSLQFPYTLKYLPFSRKLLWPVRKLRR